MTIDVSIEVVAILCSTALLLAIVRAYRSHRENKKVQ